MSMFQAVFLKLEEGVINNKIKKIYMNISGDSERRVLLHSKKNSTEL